MMDTSYNTRKKVVNQHYESQWEGYTEKDVLDRVENLANVIDPIISGLPLKPKSRILDIGSGPGIIPIRIAKENPEIIDLEIIGIDISEKAVKIGSRAIARAGLDDSIYLIKGDAENLPFQNCDFDFVVSNATLNLLPNKEKGFNEIARVTKNEGMIVIADCIAKEGKRCCKGDDDKLWSACVAGAPTKMEFQELAKNADLEVIKTTDITDEVTHLVKNKLWDWPEFLEYELEYYVFGMMKRG